MLDTDQLRAFLAIVDTGSVTRAAERVNRTQSAVSMQIRRLEERLGCELFVKNGRGVRISADGEKLVGFARSMLRIEASALATVAQKGLTGRVRLGIPDDYAEPFLPDILSRFVRKHPLVELSIVCEGSLVLAERIRTRELELAVVTDCASIQGVEVVREEPLLWATSPHLELAGDAPVPLALGSPTCYWRQMAEQALARAGRTYRLLLASNNFSAIEPMVNAGLAVTVLPASALRQGMKVVGEAQGLPQLPSSRIGLLRSPAAQTAEADALAEDIRESVGHHSAAAA